MSSKTMQVSVVIPVFNRKKVLEKAVDSVLAQQGVSFELIVVDDASTEPNEELYSRIQDRGHHVLRMEQNRGPGSCRNHGVEKARGEYVAFLDSDDHWLPEKLKAQLECLREGSLSIAQSAEIWFRDGQRVFPPKQHRITGGDLFKRSLRAVCVSSSTVILRRDLFLRLGGFDESLFVCEDYDLWLRASVDNSFGYCPTEAVVKYGGHSDQLSKALPALDRFRIWSIIKLLCRGGLKPGQIETSLAELSRKLRILGKGAAKRGKESAHQTCQAIAEELQAQRYSEALRIATELQSYWPTKP